MSDPASPVTRRQFLSAAALAAAATPLLAQEVVQQAVPQPLRSADHHLPNERQPGPNNLPLEGQNPSSVWPPETDNGAVPPFKFPFDMGHKAIDSGGWTRQVTVRELAVSKTMAGVEMYLTPGGIRELHWHVSAEWAYMITGKARITAIDASGNSFVNDVVAGDLWIFPGGIPHSIQGLGPDGAKFLLVFSDGNFNEFDTFLLSEWFNHTPPEVLAKNFNVPASTFAHVPKEKLYIFQSELPRGLEEEQKQAAEGVGEVDGKYVFRTAGMQATKSTAGGEVRIIDERLFPATPIAAAIVRLKPGGMREMHWHPLSDEWLYFVTGAGRMTIFAAGGKARTEDFQAGDVGYVEISRPHYIENTGAEEMVFLEVFPSAKYQDISAGQWLAHTPMRLVDEHLHTGEAFLKGLPKKQATIVPL